VRRKAGESLAGSLAGAPDRPRLVGASAAVRAPRSTKGAKISAAKKGVRQLELAPGELTLTEAVRETGLSYRVLRDGVDLPGPDGKPKLRHRRVARRSGRAPKRNGAAEAIIFNREQLQEDLAACPCSYPRCNKPAPGKSGRCGDHRARGEPAVELVCQYEPCGKTFVRPVSWLREREGRGHYCTNECKGLAFAAANPGRLEVLNPDGARDHHQQVAEEVAADGRLDRGHWTSAHPYRYSPSQITARALAGDVPSELRVYRGSVRRIIEPDALAADEPPWANQLERRANVAKATHGIASLRRIYARLGPGMGAQDGKPVGRPSELTPEQDKQIAWLLTTPRTQEQIAQIVGCSRDQVKREKRRLAGS
jgi:hypothetical protein